MTHIPHSALLQWQKVSAELERVGRILRAYEWTEAIARVARKQADIEASHASSAKVQKDKDRYIKEIAEAERECKAVEKRRESEMVKGGKLKKREEEVKEGEMGLVKIRTKVEIGGGSVKDEEARAAELRKEAEEVRIS